MDYNNDYLASFAQENVSFNTKFATVTVPGANYWKVMCFVEDGRYVTTTAWDAVPGVAKAKATVVNADTFADETTGILKAWLSDLYSNGFTGDCILVACGEQGSEDYSANTTIMEAAYDALKGYAYHKTCCFGETGTVPAVANALGVKCNATADDKILSSVPYLAMSYTDLPANASDIEGDPLYTSISGTSNTDGYIAVYQDNAHNGALVALGIALGYKNGTGLCVGNSFEMVKTGSIGASGVNGMNMPRTTRELYEDRNILVYKAVGDNSGFVAGYGNKSIKGEDITVRWLLGYITYMTKIQVAQLLTTPNFRKTAQSYGSIITLMANNINLFSSKNGGPLSKIMITAPGFSELPPGDNDEIVVEDAWGATYNGVLHKVEITGNLYIGG